MTSKCGRILLMFSLLRSADDDAAAAYMHRAENEHQFEIPYTASAAHQPYNTRSEQKIYRSIIEIFSAIMHTKLLMLKL